MRLLGVREDIFDHQGRPGHEVGFVYTSTIGDEVVPPDGGWFDDGGPIRVEWRPVVTTTDVPLYPDATQRLIDDLVRSDHVNS